MSSFLCGRNNAGIFHSKRFFEAQFLVWKGEDEDFLVDSNYVGCQWSEVWEEDNFDTQRRKDYMFYPPEWRIGPLLHFFGLYCSKWGRRNPFVELGKAMGVWLDKFFSNTSHEGLPSFSCNLFRKKCVLFAEYLSGKIFWLVYLHYHLQCLLVAPLERRCKACRGLNSTSGYVYPWALLPIVMRFHLKS